MIIRWIDAEGQQRSMIIEGPVTIEAEVGKRELTVRAPGQLVPKQWHWLRPQVIAVHDEDV